MSAPDLLSSKLALQVSRRQKRLSYWRDQLVEAHGGTDRMDEPQREKIEESLGTYQLLLARLISCHASKNVGDFEEAERRIAALDRELTSLFEARRLLTSGLGRAAISS